jgi:cell division protein FtsW (lipid II flippase)
MRSGSFAAITLSAGGAASATFIAITAKPYIAARFATWGKAWSDPNGGGYQQVRTMAACASGGLFGLGAGKGWFKNIFAADTDMVFGMVSEELGLIIAFSAIAVIIIMAFFAIRSADTARSTFYVISSCAAVSIMMVQIILNVFGSLDILPFTGVTFPFVSKGGSSLIVSWGLLSFIKASDTRVNASFAVKSESKEKKKGGDEGEKA